MKHAKHIYEIPPVKGDFSCFTLYLASIFPSLSPICSERAEMLIIPYSLVGIRGDCDFMLWRITYDLPKLQEMTAKLLATDLGKYLVVQRSFDIFAPHPSQHVGSVQDDQDVFFRGAAEGYVLVFIHE
jgi:hypothetical protein